MAGHADERSAQSDMPHDSTLVRDSLEGKLGGSGGACGLWRMTALGAASSVQVMFLRWTWKLWERSRVMFSRSHVEVR